MPPLKEPRLATISNPVTLRTAFTGRRLDFGYCEYKRRLQAQSLHNAAYQPVALLHRAHAGLYINPHLTIFSRLHNNPPFHIYPLLANSSTISTNTLRPKSLSKSTKMAHQQARPALFSTLSALMSSTLRSRSNSVPTTTPEFDAILVKHNLSHKDLKNIEAVLIDIATQAGSIMVAAEYSIIMTAQVKNNTSDIVTVFDKQIEDMAEKRLKEAYLTYSFLGEETSKAGTKLTDTPTFIVDPIDGTLNFTHGVPNCGISLAFTLDKKPVVGVVFNPFRGDMYHAVKGQGAFLTKPATGNTVELPFQQSPRPLPSLNSCLVAIEWGNQRKGPNWALRTSIHNALLTSKDEGGAMCKSVRSNGSAALDFCYVAHGMLDVFWEGGVYSWDVAAGWCILEEAGGIVASANPGDWNPTLEGRLYFAVRNAKPEDQKAVVEELWGMMGDRKFVYP